jgi:hypothetical protein
MFTLKIVRRTILIASAFLVTACASAGGPRMGVVYVSARPPRALVEVRPVNPSRGHVWIPGFYAWRGRDYQWMPGHFELPPTGFGRWRPGQWRHDRRGWYFVEGHWQ